MSLTLQSEITVWINYIWTSSDNVREIEIASYRSTPGAWFSFALVTAIETITRWQHDESQMLNSLRRRSRRLARAKAKVAGRWTIDDSDDGTTVKPAVDVITFVTSALHNLLTYNPVELHLQLRRKYGVGY